MNRIGLDKIGNVLQIGDLVTFVSSATTMIIGIVDDSFVDDDGTIKIYAVGSSNDKLKKVLTSKKYTLTKAVRVRCNYKAPSPNILRLIPKFHKYEG